MSNVDTGTNPTSAERIADIVCAYVSNNHVAPADLPALIANVHAALSALNTGDAANRVAEVPVEKVTAAQVRKSVTPDALISFIDGRPYKTLKRHLTKFGFSPATYRERYGLPSDYPMVAPSYSETRSSLARSLGLGQRNGRSVQTVDLSTTHKGRRKAA